MPTNEEIKAAEDKLNALNSQAAIVADMQIQLGDDVNKLRIEIKSLEAKKSSLMTALDDMEDLIKQKNAERNESLNERDKTITARENQNEYLDKKIHQEIDEFMKKEADIQLRLDVIRADEKLNSDTKERLDKKENELNLKEAYLAQQISENISRAGVQEEKIKTANEAIAIYKEKGSKAEDLVAENETLKDKLQALIDANQEKQDAFNKGLAEFENRKKELDEKEAAIDAKREENDKLHEGQLAVDRENFKKIQLAWLQVNKKITDNKLDLDLKELQK